MASHMTHYENGCKTGKEMIQLFVNKPAFSRGETLEKFRASKFQCACCARKAAAEGFVLEAVEETLDEVIARDRAYIAERAAKKAGI